VILIWGFRSKLFVICTAMMRCGRCGRTCAQSLRRVKRYFTLFFIPLIPISTKHFVVCTGCAAATQITAEQAAEIEGHVFAGGPVPGSMPPPPQEAPGYTYTPPVPDAGAVPPPPEAG
jgi:hypothetical protein